MTRRPGLVLVALASAAALVAGCGAATDRLAFDPASGTNNSSQSPAAELTSAVAALGQGPTLTATASLGTTAGVLGPILHSLGATLTAAQVSALAGARISVEVAAPHGKSVADVRSADDNASYAFTLSANGTTYVSLRSLDHTLYLQIDLKDLFTTIGEAGKYATLERKGATEGGFVQALLAGKWVSVPAATLSLLKSLSGGGGFGLGPSASPSPAQVPHLIATLRALFAHDVTVTRLSSGPTDRLALSADPRALAAGLARSFAAAMPGARTGQPGLSPGDLPARRVTMTADVVHGALSKLSANLGQYERSKNVDVPLNVTFSRSGPAISAPSGAVEADTVGLLGLLNLLSGEGNPQGGEDNGFGASLGA